MNAPLHAACHTQLWYGVSHCRVACFADNLYDDRMKRKKFKDKRVQAGIDRARRKYIERVKNSDWAYSYEERQAGTRDAEKLQIPTFTRD